MTEPNSWIILEVFGDSDPVRALNGGESLDTGEDNPISPVAKAFQHAALNHALGKAPLEDWNEELGDAAPAPKPAKPFAKSSEERFARVSARIREICGDATETAEDIITLAEKMRREAVAEIVAKF
jgi:hypothetical protein